MNKLETNTFKRQKQELEEIRNESFKQGIWKGKEEAEKDIQGRLTKELVRGIKAGKQEAVLVS